MLARQEITQELPIGLKRGDPCQGPLMGVQDLRIHGHSTELTLRNRAVKKAKELLRNSSATASDGVPA